jgi:hypothetical protein
MTKENFNTVGYENANAKLLARIEAAIKKYKGNDFRDGDYFSSECEPVFQKIAEDLAQHIKQYGIQRTDASLIHVAKDVSDFIETWGVLKGSSVGFIFENALKKNNNGKKNPFAGLGL